MSKQITVRLPEELVVFMDSVVAGGEASSRAAVVAQALDRQQRRQVAARDAAILAGVGSDPDLDGLAEYAASLIIDALE